MYALLLKDLRSAGLFLWIVVPAFLLYGGQFLAVGSGYYWSSLVGTAFLSVAVTALDWKYETDRFVCSLPVDRRRFVQERYLLAIGVTLSGYLAAVAYGWAISRLFPIRDQVSELTSWPGAGVFVLTVMLVFSVYYPCYFRWGLGGGFARFSLIILALLGFILLIPTARRLLAWSGPMTGGGRFTAAFAGSMVIAVLPAVKLSLALSVRAYRRRDF